MYHELAKRKLGVSPKISVENSVNMSKVVGVVTNSVVKKKLGITSTKQWNISSIITASQ